MISKLSTSIRITGTQNYEWYDPAAVTTSDGAMHITLSETPNHNLNFRGE